MFFQKLRSRSLLPRFKGDKPYIVPTIYGMLFLFLIVDIFALGYYRSTAPFHTVGLTLIVFGVVSMIQTNANIQNIAIKIDRCEMGAAGSTSEIRISIRNNASAPAYNLRIQVDRPFAMSEPLQIRELSAHMPFALPISCPERGVYALTRIKVHSRGIYGLFYTWRWQDVDAELIVYPAPRGALPLPGGSEGAAQRSLQSEDFVGHRRFAAGDSLKHIDWKAYARGSDLLLKDFADQAMDALDLRWSDSRGGTEERLEQLSAWILKMNRLQRPYSLHLPSDTIGRGMGEAHDRLALRALAVFKET